MFSKLCVVALGGNALLHRGEAMEAQTQRANIAIAAQSLAALVHSRTLVITHGNGPQIGLLALQAEGYPDARPYPLDVLGAETQGMIGYLIEQELRNRLPEREIASLLTQVIVSADDPAFLNPTKPIGPMYTKEEAEDAARKRSIAIAKDGSGFRRVVPSPAPLRIVEINTIRLLVDASVIVICGGGGGIPVVVSSEDRLIGVEAVIDKDASAALLAEELGAGTLVLLTDVSAVWTDYGQSSARAIRQASPAALAHHSFAQGSMGPKIAAACRFVERTGGTAAIGALQDAEAILEGRKGTIIQADPNELLFYPADELMPSW